MPFYRVFCRLSSINCELGVSNIENWTLSDTCASANCTSGYPPTFLAYWDIWFVLLWFCYGSLKVSFKNMVYGIASFLLSVKFTEQSVSTYWLRLFSSWFYWAALINWSRFIWMFWQSGSYCFSSWSYLGSLCSIIDYWPDTFDWNCWEFDWNV